MKWTSLQENGQLRTIDSENASTLDLVTEFALDWPFGKKKRKAKSKALKNKSVERVKVKFNWWVVIGMVAFVIFLVLLQVLLQ